MAENYNTRKGGLWVQPDGPNNAVYFLGCHDLDDLEEPITGGVTPVRKFDPHGRGWLTVGRNRTPPDPISTTLTSLLFQQRDWLEKLNCPFTLFVLMRDCGDADVFLNYTRGWALRNVEPITRTYAGLAAREEEAESTVALEISADVPLVQINPLEVDNVVVTLAVLAANGVWTNRDSQCFGDCGDTVNPGDQILFGLDSAVGPAKADLFWSTNGLLTSLAAVTDPLAAGALIGAVGAFWLNKTTKRLLVAGGIAAGQGQVAYSDDSGTTWTTVSIGGAAANHSPLKGSGLFILDQYHLWLGTQLGYIYKSVDAGETWTAVESGSIAVTTWHAIHFSDAYNGVAVTDADVIITTTDGGLTWEAQTATGSGANIISCYMIDPNRIWVGTATGRLFFTRDGGTTWTERTGQGFGALSMYDIEFAPGSDLIGFLISTAAGPVSTLFRTIDGGKDWQPIDTPTNAGLNDLAVASADRGYLVGEAVGGHPITVEFHATN